MNMNFRVISILLLGLTICVGKLHASDNIDYTDLIFDSTEKNENILVEEIPSDKFGDTDVESYDENDNDQDSGYLQFPRFKRQATLTEAAISRSLTNNPVGKPEFKGLPVEGGYFKDIRNFGGRVGGSGGVKVWESGKQSVGIGASGQINTGLRNGHPFANNPGIGAGVGYRNGRFFAGVGGSRGYVGGTVGMRFKREASTFSNGQKRDGYHGVKVTPILKQHPYLRRDGSTRAKRQLNLSNEAIHRSLTNNAVGKPEFRGMPVQNPYFHNYKNFGARVGGSAGVRAWESGRQSVGVGVSGQVNTGFRNGRPYVNKPAVGVGLGYQNGGFRAGIGKSGREISGSIGYQRGRFSAGLEGSRRNFQGTLRYQF